MILADIYIIAYLKNCGGNRRRDEVEKIQALIMGTPYLKFFFFRIGKHKTGTYSFCSQVETVEQVLVECSKGSKGEEPQYNNNFRTSGFKQRVKTFPLMNI